MTIEVEVVAKEIIKPSSPTPHHLQIFPLSGLDQFYPTENVPFYIFYPATPKDKTPQIHHLKQSLSQTLTHIYPFGGRMSTDNKYITCEDEGVNFFEAHVHGVKLSQFLANPQPEELAELLPRDDELFVSEVKPLLSIQVNFFDGGEMALGLLISHKLADGLSIYLFLNCWARIARGEKEIYQPKLGTTSTFPPNNVPPIVPPITIAVERTSTKRFVFNTADMAKLFAKPPSRSIAVIAVIWRCAINARRRVRGGAKTASVATFAVNLRSKQLPGLSENSLGNCVVCTTTKPTAENQLELPDLVDKLREAIKIVDSEYAKQLKAGDLMFLEPFGEVNELCSKGEVERYLFSSVCNFPFYETDFGWGKPIWVTTPVNVGQKNTFVLMDTKSGAGIEAWVCLDEEDMARFELDPDLIALTSPNSCDFHSKL